MWKDNSFKEYNIPITSLPEGLKVGDSLNLSNTKITSLPQGLKVEGFLDLNNTPLAKRYSKEELKKMLPGVRGSIFI